MTLPKKATPQDLEGVSEAVRAYIEALEAEVQELRYELVAKADDLRKKSFGYWQSRR